MPKLFVIHGWTYNIEPWQNVAGYLKDKGLEVELLRVPGLTSPSKKVWTTAAYVDWAEQNLPDKAIALGHSNGGRILLNLINKYPNKLSGIILLDSAGIYEKSFKRNFMRTLSKMFAPFKNIPLVRKFFHRIIGASDYAKAPDNMKKTLQNVIDSDKALRIDSKLPARIIWGEEDQITPLRQGKRIHQGLRNSHLTIKKQWGHSPYLKTPKELADQILKEYNAVNEQIDAERKSKK